MKKIKLKYLIIPLIGSFFISLIIYSGCSKEKDPVKPISKTDILQIQENSDIDERLVFYYKELLKNQSDRAPRFWKWLKAHSGITMFGDCGLDLPCGPCPGLCLSTQKDSSPFTIVVPDYQLSIQEYANGERIIQLLLFNDTILGLNILNNDLVYHDTVFIFENFSLGHDISSLFDQESITILEGSYPVTYSHGDNGTTLLNVSCQ